MKNKDEIGKKKLKEKTEVLRYREKRKETNHLK